MSASEPRSYGAGARVLGAGVAATGVVTFAYFAVASHVLTGVEYKRISLLWAILLPTVTVIYRPVEQLLSRTIAERRARGLEGGHPWRAPLAIQGGFALVFLAVALPLHGRLFDGSASLFGILVAGVLAYAASYFARGWLAGHQRFGLYGGLVLLESSSRFAFALAVAVGIASGQTAVALGMAAAPAASLLVVPWALRRDAGAGAARDAEGVRGSLDLRRGGPFAAAVLGIQLAEQTLVNAAVIVVAATATDPALAGLVFNVLLIIRAPLVLFQAIQTSLLPHLTRQETTGRDDRAIHVTVAAVAAFAGVAALALLLAGPWAMRVLFGHGVHYRALGLAAVAVGMGFHLVAATLNQAALARGRAAQAAAAWLVVAALFVAWMASSATADAITRAEVGYLGAAGILAGLLLALYRRDASGAPLTPAR